MEPIDRIDRYLNGELTPEEVRQLEQELTRNDEFRQTLEGLRITQRAVQIGNVRAEVRQAHTQFMTELRDAPTNETDQAPATGKIMPMPDSRNRGTRSLGWVMRIAAGVSLLLIGFVGYQAATLDGSALYDNKYVNYRLTSTRGSDAPPPALEARYRAGDYSGVLKQAATLPNKQAPDLFLTAMAHLQLKQFEQAVDGFNRVRVANRSLTNPYFGPETDYYLGLAYIGSGQYDEAYQTWKPIYANDEHSYHDLITQADLWRLRALAWLR